MFATDMETQDMTLDANPALLGLAIQKATNRNNPSEIGIAIQKLIDINNTSEFNAIKATIKAITGASIDKLNSNVHYVMRNGEDEHVHL